MADRRPAVAVLAAGSATRFGGGKLDALCAGRPLGRWALDSVGKADLPTGLLVVPPQGAAFACAAAGWQRATNPQPERGLGTSLALAARWAIERHATGLLVLLADMPLVDPMHLRRLADAPAPAATEHPGSCPGVPAVLTGELLALAAELKDDSGAAHLLARADGLTLLAAPEGSLLDVDCAEDLARAEEWLVHHQRSLDRA